MYRLLSIGIVLLWISAMAALFMRDVWPAWTAQDAPPMTKEQFAGLADREQQFGIFGADGQRTGTAWSDISSSGGNTAIRGTVHLERLPYVSTILVETLTEFDPEGELDTFRLDVFGVPMTVIWIRGERRGIYFPCDIKVGPLSRQANLDLSASRMIGDSLRPFEYLPTLKVGQAWRMQMVDPVSAALGGRIRLVPIIAQVTRRETITHQGKPVDCFLVETTPGQTKAWVGTDGKVLVQEADVPGVGRITVREEPYEDTMRTAARTRIRRGQESNVNLGSEALEGVKRSVIGRMLGGDNDSRD